MVKSIPVTTEQLYAHYRRCSVITTDSRKIPPGSIFFALKGENFNGNLFAAQALEKGAAFAVVDDPAMSQDQRYLLVHNVLQSLQEIARTHRQQMHIPVIGITGSNGKTTTKELIHAVLSSRYLTRSTSGNLNNHIGVPLTLLSIRPETEIAVIEMGANHPGEIAFLCELARPTHGLITNIGKAHLEGFGSFEGIIRAKTELYTFLRKNMGNVFLNAGDSLLAKYATGLPAIMYGLVAEAGTSGKIIWKKEEGRGKREEDGLSGVEITFPDGQKREVISSLFGSYNALNLLAAAAVGYHFDIPPLDIAASLEACIPANNRSQIYRSERNLLVLDAYNANPSSMSAALHDFDRSFQGNNVVILGDMLELGKESEDEHLAILGILEKLNFDKVFLIGPIFSKLNKNPDWITFEDT
ncbi:MAG: UDP-N-acetylmuramoyl-tripeptide--D-alanyl-D-alanine ligase, partial [Bacteroidales bacterium]|nr:UDP-N-acetylmuramoyl-tripeptide--D-alanyl-D-alanine ligase [Bacteroidales bacterium]